MATVGRVSGLNQIGHAHDRLTALTFAIAQICLCAVVFSFSYETIARYFFAAPTSWSNEVVAYALCVGTFLALPEVTRTTGHIAITFVVEALPGRAQARFNIFLALLSAAVCLFVAWICLRTNISHFTRQEMTVGVNPVPKWVISIWLTYGFASSGLHFLRQAFAAERFPSQQAG
ncbi:MAG: TRAP transporter small permease [Pseudomonadota bacterium]|nr:TRAP transporter small permease [Pseudomonadota bacterium]